MSIRQKIIGGFVAVIVAFAFGYWCAPEKVKVEKQVVEVEKKTEKTDEAKHVDTVTTEVTKPDGTKETTTHTVEDTNSQVIQKDNISVSESESKEVTKSSSKLNISVLGGIDLKSKAEVYGAHVDRNLLGPITVGLWGLSNGSVGASVGLTF